MELDTFQFVDFVGWLLSLIVVNGGCFDEQAMYYITITADGSFDAIPSVFDFCQRHSACHICDHFLVRGIGHDSHWLRHMIHTPWLTT